jgi:hypothetical protein
MREGSIARRLSHPSDGIGPRKPERVVQNGSEDTVPFRHEGRGNRRPVNPAPEGSMRIQLQQQSGGRTIHRASVVLRAPGGGDDDRAIGRLATATSAHRHPRRSAIASRGGAGKGNQVGPGPSTRGRCGSFQQELLFRPARTAGVVAFRYRRFDRIQSANVGRTGTTRRNRHPRLHRGGCSDDVEPNDAAACDRGGADQPKSIRAAWLDAAA